MDKRRRDSYSINSKLNKVKIETVICHIQRQPTNCDHLAYSPPGSLMEGLSMGPSDLAAAVKKSEKQDRSIRVETLVYSVVHDRLKARNTIWYYHTSLTLLSGSTSAEAQQLAQEARVVTALLAHVQDEVAQVVAAVGALLREEWK